jgi:hypothetical protein
MSWVVCMMCSQKFCPTCQEEFHTGFTCEQRQQWKIDNDQNYAKTQEWITKSTQNCPKCNVIIEKQGGCAHMKCRHCSFEFCWLCKEEYWNGHIREKHWKPERDARLSLSAQNPATSGIPRLSTNSGILRFPLTPVIPQTAVNNSNQALDTVLPIQLPGVKKRVRRPSNKLTKRQIQAIAQASAFRTFMASTNTNIVIDSTN